MDILSGVASGIAVAQLAGSGAEAVLKLKRLWNEVQDVPENIMDLLEQIDCLDPAIWESEQHFTNNELSPLFWNDAAARSSTEYCRKALGRLSSLVDDLSIQIKLPKQSRLRKKIACVKAVLKKDQLNILEGRLRNAVGMLQMAQLGYIIALVKLQPDIIVNRVAAHFDGISRTNRLLEIEENNSEADTDQTHRRTAQRMRLTGTEETDREADVNRISSETAQPQSQLVSTRPHTGQVVRREPWKKLCFTGRLAFQSSTDGYISEFQPPSWLADSMFSWSLHAAKSYSGWKIHLRSYSIRPRNALVFDAARFGWMDLLQKMFSSGEASPYDRDEGGQTLLHYIGWYINIRRYFNSLEVAVFLIELGVNPCDRDNSGRIAFDSYRTGCYVHFWDFTLEPCFDKFVSSGFFPEVDLDYPKNVCRCLPAKDWKSTRNMQPYICPAHHQTTLSSRLQVLRSNYLYIAENFMVILDPDWSQNPYKLMRSVLLEKKMCYAIEVVRNTEDIHRLEHTTDGTLTPLLQLVSIAKNWGMSPRSGLKIWLQILKEAGIDLRVYGKRENQILRDSKLELVRSFQHDFRREGRRRQYFYCQIGPEPADWDIWMSEPTDEFVGDFWESVENPPLRILGGWVD